MPDVGCPKCGQPLTPDTSRTHCPGESYGSCWWGIHSCSAVVDLRRPARWIDYYPNWSQGAHEG